MIAQLHKKIGLFTWLSITIAVLGVVNSGCNSHSAGEPVLQEASQPVIASSPEKAALQQNFATLVDEENMVFRSGQPSAEDFRLLYNSGFKSVLNLRRHHSDADEAAGVPITLYHIPTNAGSLSEAELLAALTVLKQAEKPIVFHCWHGADRTGTLAAAYRIAIQNWSIEAAISELKEPQYNYHSLVYPNLIELLETMNWDKIRADLSQVPMRKPD